MKVCRTSLFALLIAAAALPATGQTVNAYDASRAGNPAAPGPAMYPAGVFDPSLTNPPPAEAVVPLPSAVSSRAYEGPACSPVMQADPLLVAPAEASPAVIGSFYTRIEYFHWNEQINSVDNFVNEAGALFTLGCMRETSFGRFRAEVFGGDVCYHGFAQVSTSQHPTYLEYMPPSTTGYLGLRGEYEMLWAPPELQGQAAFLMGLGSRFWVRSLSDGVTTPTALDPNLEVYGYREIWWTTYPYLGLETHRSLGKLELYSESRIGATAATFNFAAGSDRPLRLFPGVIANVEIGLRGERFFVAARGEVMNWTQSAWVQGACQPNSLMVTIGGRLGFMF